MHTPKKRTVFGLTHPTYGVLGIYTSSNSDGEFCCNVQHTLSTDEDSIWMTPTKEQAEKVAKTDTPWYNAGYDSPSNPFSKDGLLVIEIEMTMKVLK